MRLSRLAPLLTGCAVLALSAPAAAQSAPILVQPPVAPAATQVPSDETLPPASAADEAPAAPEATIVPIPAVWAPVPTNAAGESAYGLYLAGRLASIRGDTVTGAELLARGQELVPEQPLLGEEAFRAGLFGGDLGALATLAPAVQDQPLLAEAGRLVVIVDGLNDGDAAAGLALLRARPFAEPFAVIGRYLLPALAAGAGDWDLALAPPAAAATDIDALVLRHQRARLLETRRRYPEAEAEYRSLIATPLGGPLFAADFGAFLERRGRRDEALTVYEASLSGASPDPDALVGRTRVLARAAPPPAPTIRDTAAFAIKIAALRTGERGQRDVSAIFLRLAQSLGHDDEIGLRLGLNLAALGHEDAAREAFGSVTGASPILYAGAQFGLGLSLQREGQDEDALAAFRRADAAAPGQVEVSFRLAQHLIALERHEEALAVLNRPSVNIPAQAPGIRYLRGATLERLGRLDEAENELWAALTAAPDEPSILNHLGYMWVDTGRRVEQGAEMLARAHATEPDNGNIQDSLGWAQFRQGQYDVAVQTLEAAVDKEPGNAEINDHLGDAYWQVGRLREARWQWDRVLTLEPDAERRAEVEQKLAQGLSIAPPVSAGGS
ncbi:MAG: tetratricopeptide repeat protein [Brevundimonas sp.]